MWEDDEPALYAGFLAQRVIERNGRTPGRSHWGRPTLWSKAGKRGSERRDGPIVEGFTSHLRAGNPAHIDDAPAPLRDRFVEPGERAISVIQRAVGEGRDKDGEVVVRLGVQFDGAHPLLQSEILARLWRLRF